jgi:succinyl-diaminopimelate desuccinylase
LVAACAAAIREITGLQTRLSTAGGTSDGRFIAPTGAQVVELGPVNKDLAILSEIYARVLKELLT